MATKKESIVKKIEKEIVKDTKKVVKAVEKEVKVIEKDIKKVVSPKSTEKAKAAKPSKKELDDKKAKLLEKAKALAGKVKDDKPTDLKKKLKPEEEAKDTLVPMEDYLKSSIHLGTRVITPDMRNYVYRRRADGLAVFNTALLDDKIRAGAEYLSKYNPEQIILVCKREAGWQAAKKFSEATGIKVFTKKYPAGILTNTNLEDFTEADLIFISDPWLDKNALNDANKIGVPVLSICDTNNFTQGIDHIIPGNNKSAKSLGIIFYLLAMLYKKAKKLDTKLPPITEFIDNWDNLVPPK